MRSPRFSGRSIESPATGAEMRPPQRSATTFLVAVGMVLFSACQDAATPVGPIFDEQGPFAFDLRMQTVEGPVGGRCSLGDARALLETLIVANDILVRHGPDQPWAATLVRCQYRLFWEAGHPILGAPVTFTEEDFFLGGATFNVPYRLLGMTMQQAAAILDAIDVQIWLAEVTETGIGDFVEQPVMTSSTLKHTMSDVFGFVLWRQWGFISQLPPGEYVSVAKVTRPLFFQDEFLWTVTILIV